MAPRHYVPTGGPRGGSARRRAARNSELYQRHANGESYPELAIHYGISRQRVHQVVKAEKRMRILRALRITAAKGRLPLPDGRRTRTSSNDEMPDPIRPKGFAQRVKAWRDQEILRAADELLAAVGCFAFKINVVASTAGVAKRTVSRFAGSRESLIAAVLEWRLNELALGEPKQTDNALVGLTAVIKMLCGVADRPEQGARADFPCCLRTSPCPHGWMNRWQTISAIYGLTPGNETAMLGEAVQELAALPASKALLEQGRFAARYELLLMTLIGDLREASP